MKRITRDAGIHASVLVGRPRAPAVARHGVRRRGLRRIRRPPAARPARAGGAAAAPRPPPPAPAPAPRRARGPAARVRPDGAQLVDRNMFCSSCRPGAAAAPELALPQAALIATGLGSEPSATLVV